MSERQINEEWVCEVLSFLHEVINYENNKFLSSPVGKIKKEELLAYFCKRAECLLREAKED